MTTLVDPLDAQDVVSRSMQTRTWHHLFAWGFVVFAILHVYIVFYDGLQ